MLRKDVLVESGSNYGRKLSVFEEGEDEELVVEVRKYFDSPRDFREATKGGKK